MKVNCEMLTESKSLRETVIDRVDVLEKVKKLAMLPNDINTTVEMTAEFYEVDYEVIKKTIQRNKKELESDGLKVLSGDELRDMKSLGLVAKNAPHFTVITRRAVLRIGMLLQESEVAKAVRSYLLDKEEEKQQIPDISGLSPQLQFMIMMEQKHNALETKHNELSKGFEQVKGAIQTIQETIVSRDENWRRMVNGMMNAAVYRLNTNHADLRNKSYAMLEERANCNLKTRLTNWHKRLEQQGYSKSKVEAVTRMDVIDSDPKLREIYTAIVKELSISSFKLIN